MPDLSTPRVRTPPWNELSREEKNKFIRNMVERQRMLDKMLTIKKVEKELIEDA